MTTWLICIGAAYLVGSIPFGVLISRARGVDIRAHGSRNIGATNVGRVLGRPLGFLCFALDFLKGAAPVLIAGAASGALGTRAADLEASVMWLWMAVAAAAVIGHMWSVFLRFTGGKGVATSFGAIVSMWPLLTFPALGSLVVWYAALRFTKYVSIASIAAAVMLPVWFVVSLIPNSGALTLDAVRHAAPPIIVTAGIAALVVWRHRGNLARIRRGVEPKTGEPDP